MKEGRRISVNNRELWISILVSAGIVLGAILISGTFFTGFHLIDDHEFVTAGQMIRDDGLLRTMLTVIQRDLTIRFRPVYWFFRILGIWLLGLNWQLWYLVKAAEIIVSMVCFYWLARRLKCGRLVSAIFSLLILCGPQTEIWCRLGPQESLGIMLLSVLLLVETLEYSRKRNVIMAALIFLLSGAKEAFTVLMPAICFFAVWYELFQKGSVFGIKEIWKGILKNGGFILFSAVLCIAELLLIVFAVGTDDLSYAGFTAEMSFKDYIWKFQAFLKEDRIRYYYLVAGVSALLSIAGGGIKKWKAEGQKYLYALLMLLYVVAVQLVLHIRSGMVGRYYIPWIVGISALICIFGIQLTKHRRLLNRLQIAAAAGLCVYAVSLMKAPLDKFVELGKSTAFVIGTLQDEYEDGDRIMTDLGGGELDSSLTSWLTIEEGISEVYPFDKETAGDMEFIVTVNDETAKNAELAGYGLDTGQYERTAFGRYAVYQKVKKDGL